MNAVKRNMVFMAVSARRTITDLSVDPLISLKPVKAALAPFLCLAVSFLRLVFLLTSYTSMTPTAEEQSGMAEWNSILTTMTTSVVQVLWPMAPTSSMRTLLWESQTQLDISSAGRKF
ncbi:hypothetical protein PO909_012480 [Leuciscus waleckii]